MSGFCVRLTGKPGSGQTTLSNALADRLRERGYAPVILDGADVWGWPTPDCDFSQERRCENVLRTARVAKAVVDSGGVVIVALVSLSEEDRREAVEIVGSERFGLIHLFGRENAVWKGSTYEEPCSSGGKFTIHSNSLRSIPGQIAQNVITACEFAGFLGG